jgi:hypothetical protein
MDPVYPKPDRSNVPRNFSKTPENEVIDVGWQEGVLEDGRPFHGEYWAQDQVGVMTFFFSTLGIENATKEEMEALVEREGLLQFKPGKRYVQVEKYIDAAGSEMFSVNIVVGDDEETYIESGKPLTRYVRPS